MAVAGFNIKGDVDEDDKSLIAGVPLDQEEEEEGVLISSSAKVKIKYIIILLNSTAGRGSRRRRVYRIFTRDSKILKSIIFPLPPLPLSN